MADANEAQKIKRREATVSAQKAQLARNRGESLAEFLARSPLRGSSLHIGRIKDRPRKIEL